MLVRDVEVPYDPPPPPLDSLNQLLSVDFYALSDETYCQKQITGNIVKICHFQYGSREKMPKNEKWEFP